MPYKISSSVSLHCAFYNFNQNALFQNVVQIIRHNTGVSISSVFLQKFQQDRKPDGGVRIHSSFNVLLLNMAW